MKPKERFIIAPKRGIPDRVPMFEFLFSPKLQEKLIGYRTIIYDGKTIVKLASKLGIDGVPVFIGGCCGFEFIETKGETFTDVWGIKPTEVYVGGNRDIVFSKNPPLYNLDSLDDVRNYNYPRLEWFDFSTYKNNSEQIVYNSEDEQDEIKLADFERSDKYFLNTSCMNSIFMTSIFMRGMDKMLMDLISNKKYAEMLINNIDEFMLEFCKKNLESIGKYIDLYGIWDDFAMQDGLMISPNIWRKFYKPWYKKIIEVAKKYDLFICFYICGNCTDVIPDLIEMGVDILDPVQTSAKNMEVSNLKKLFGKDIWFHRGLDIQKFLPFATPDGIRSEVKRIKELFEDDGGIILGPSHYITADTPIGNILAIYK